MTEQASQVQEQACFDCGKATISLRRITTRRGDKMIVPMDARCASERQRFGQDADRVPAR